MAARRAGGARRKPVPNETESEEQAREIGAQMDRGIAAQQKLEQDRARRAAGERQDQDEDLGLEGRPSDFPPERLDDEEALELERKLLKEEWSELGALVAVVQKGLHDSRVLEAAAGALETMVGVRRRLQAIARICGAGGRA